MKRKGGMIPTTRWTNIGAWVAPSQICPSVGVKTPWGNLIIKRRDDALFSERYGYTPSTVIGPIRLTWVRLRKWTHSPPTGIAPSPTIEESKIGHG